MDTRSNCTPLIVYELCIELLDLVEEITLHLSRLRESPKWDTHGLNSKSSSYKAISMSFDFIKYFCIVCIQQKMIFI